MASQNPSTIVSVAEDMSLSQYSDNFQSINPLNSNANIYVTENINNQIIKNTNLTVIETGIANSLPVSSVAPASPRLGQTYFDPKTNLLRVWNGATWVTVSPAPPAAVYTSGTGLTLSGANAFYITNTGVTPGTYGNGTHTASLTINQQGQITAATSVQLTANAQTLTGTFLSPTVVTSSLTKLGTLTDLDVSGIANVGNLNSTNQIKVLAPTGTAPFLVNSGTMVANLNVEKVGNFSAAIPSTPLTVVARDALGNVSGSQLISTVGLGVAPLQVTSTTKVANLNVDMLDGYDTNLAAVASTIPVRDSVGIITANGFIGQTIDSGTVLTPGTINGTWTLTSGSSLEASYVRGALTFNNGGVGSPPGTTYNGNSATLISYNTVGSPSITGAGATGTWAINITGGLGNSVTFNTSGAGGATGTAFNGSVPQTISYNTIGAPSVTGIGASGTWGIDITGKLSNAVTFNTTGAGGSSGTLFDGSSPQIVSYNTVGAPSTTGTNASGTWGINITGSLANNVTFNSSGIGGPSGTAYDGSINQVVSFNTVGAPSTTGTNASGTWGINVTGSAATAGTVTIGAQPNITSVGTLTGLLVSGTANVGALAYTGAYTPNTALTVAGSIPIVIGGVTYKIMLAV